MSAQLFTIGACICCKKSFTFNAKKVPRTETFTNTPEPICKECFAMINEKRKERGLKPFTCDERGYEPEIEELP